MKGAEHDDATGGWTCRFYQRVLTPLLSILAGLCVPGRVVLLFASVLFYTRSVTVKMLPFDNKWCSSRRHAKVRRWKKRRG
jgi:hypothetical protein